MIQLKENERIITTVRRYGLTYSCHFIFVLIILTTDFFFMFWLFAKGWWGIVLYCVGLLISAYVFFRTLFVWKKNQMIITTHRIVDIDQNGFFDKTVSEVPYDRVEDVSGRICGFFGTIFRYGEIVIQTGAGKVQIVLEKVKQPVKLQQQINDLIEKYLNGDF